MSMENYSPSHPTEEVDLDNSSDYNIKICEINNQTHILSKLDKKSTSKTPENRNSPRHRSRSKSRSNIRKSRSGSKNRRSHSRNRCFNKDRDYGSRKNRRSYSKERRSRSKERKPRRSRSRDSKKYINSRDSPSQYRQKDLKGNFDKRNDNIFSKMTELSSKSSESVVKSKWNYNSDEEAISSNKQDKNSFETSGRYEDTKYLPRADFDKERGYGDQPNRFDDMKPLQRRSEFGRRGGGIGNDQYRGYNRSRQWQQRNPRSNYQPRGDSKYNRNNSGTSNNDGDDNSKWQSVRYEESKSDHDDSSYKKSWPEDENDKSESWNKTVDRNYPSSSSQKDTLDNIEKSVVELDKQGFAADSDEEFGNWGNDKKNTITINEMLTIANLESQGYKKSEEIPNFQNKIDDNALGDNSGEEFGAWGSEQKNTTKISKDSSLSNRQDSNNNWNQSNIIKPKMTSSDNLNDSDEEYGSWGKDRKPNTSQSNDNNKDQYDLPGQQFYSQNPRPNFNRNNDGNNRFHGRRGGNNNFNRFQRPNNNNQQHPHQDRFNQNPNNFNNLSNYSGNHFNINNTLNNMHNNVNTQSQDQMGQIPMQIPPYNFNPSQRPPQWVPINNMNFPPICNGQMPFTPMSLLPQMQFSQMNQQPPISIPNMMQTLSYIPPPPPSNQPSGNNGEVPLSTNYNSSISKANSDSSNLLETIMTNVGLSSKSIRMQSDVFKPQSSPSQIYKPPVNDSFSNIIKSAASSVLSRLVENSQKSNNNNAGNISDSMSMSPPSPVSSPPPIRHNYNIISSESSEFVLPPLPNYSDIVKPIMNNLPNTLASGSHSNIQSSEICEEKRNRSDFESKSDWQERIALEVKNFLRPAYMSKKISKSDYKEIMKRCVTKISRSGVTEINTEKIEKFVLSYVDKYQKLRRVKQHGVVSSSEHELVM